MCLINTVAVAFVATLSARLLQCEMLSNTHTLHSRSQEQTGQQVHSFRQHHCHVQHLANTRGKAEHSTQFQEASHHHCHVQLETQQQRQWKADAPVLGMVKHS